MPPDKQLPETIQPPPFLKTWPRVYAGVLSYLAVLLAVLYIITKVFRY
jgi:hypothetical protein